MRFLQENKDFHWNEHINWVLKNVSGKGYLLGLLGFDYEFECHIWFIWNVTYRNMTSPFYTEEQKQLSDEIHQYLRAVGVTPYSSTFF